MKSRKVMIEILMTDYVAQGQTETLADMGFNAGNKVEAEVFDDGEAVVMLDARISYSHINLSPCEFKEI